MSRFVLTPGAALAVLLLATPAALAQIPTEIIGPSPTSATGFGTALSSVGDVDGDGRGELLIGQPNNDRAFVYSGASGLLIRQIDPPPGASLFGSAIAGLGVPTPQCAFVVGAPGQDDGAVVDAGRAYLYTAASGVPVATLSYPGMTSSSGFGSTVALLPIRTTGSEQPQCITAVGAPGHSVGSAANVGSVYLFTATGQRFDRPGFNGSGEPNARFGAAVAAVDDLSGDGGGDVIVAAPGENRVYVFEGNTGRRVHIIDVSIPTTGTTANAVAVTGVPDADGDGRGDILVGSFANGSGVVILFSGRTGALLRTFVSPNPDGSALFGTAVAGVPDADGDGRGDVLVGARNESYTNPDGSVTARVGRAYLFSGSTGALIRTFNSPASLPGRLFGDQVAGVFDSNGRGDVAVRAARSPSTTINGAVFHYRNQTRTLTLDGQQGWRLLSAPVTTSIGQILGPTWTQGSTGADVSDGAPNVYVYNETVVGDRGLGYTGLTNIAVPNVLGAGYAVYVYRDDDAVTPGTQGAFPKMLRPQGLPYEGTGRDVSFPVSFTESSAVQNDGWNLVGNPYNASLDWDASVWVKQNVDNTIYVYDPIEEVYRTWNGSAGSLLDGVVAESQGFWVKANAASPFLSTTYAATTTASAPQAPRGTAPAAFGIEIAGTVGGRPVQDAAFVSFVDGAADGLDPYDAYELSPFTDTFVSLHAVASGDAGTLLDIDARAPLSGEATFVLDAAAFAASAPAGGDFTLAWPDISGVPAAWSLTLTDTETNTVVDLRTQATYAFTLGTSARAAMPGPGSPGEVVTGPPIPTLLRLAGTGTRFVVSVRGISVATEGTAEAQAFALDAPRPNPAAGVVALPFTLAEPGPVRLAVYDALGRQIAVVVEGSHEAGRHTVPFDASRLPAGLYVVRLDAAGTLAVRTLTVVR